MSRSHTFPFVLALSALILLACGSQDDQSVRQEARESLRDIPEGSVAPPASSTGAAAAVPTSGVQHYVCPNNCEGSGGPAQANCPVCGTAYEHNQAYHSQQPAVQSNPTITPSTPGAPAASQPITTPTEPAVNAAGVYHYTCPDGHSGGAGTAAACATCGKTLVHNAAYHN